MMKIKMALFFDGTCNNKNASIDKMTNVGKLFDVHQGTDIATLMQKNPKNNIDTMQGFKLYIRGVGTKKFAQDLDNLDDDLYENIVFGSAFGAGGRDRICYAVNSVCELVKAIEPVFNEVKNSKAMETEKLGADKLIIEWDLFGFSRGAALSRYFVNVINQALWEANSDDVHAEITCKLRNINHQIRFLGIFDTVGSFGIPGNNIDPYLFDVDTAKVAYIYHLCAEDELRENFDLQSVLKPSAANYLSDSEQQAIETYSANIEDIEQLKQRIAPFRTWCIEESYPGVHGDIGGGYGSELEQGLDNNQLSRIYLRKMHSMALAVGVEFEYLEQCLKCFPDVWQIELNLKQRFEQLIAYYQTNPGLKRKHQIFRCHQRYREVAALDFKRKNFRYSNYARILKKFLRKFDYFRIELVRKLLIAECFTKESDAEVFFEQYECFRSDYIHTSHFPANGIPGMDAQKAPIDFDAWPAKQLKDKRYYMNLPFQLKRKIY